MKRPSALFSCIVVLGTFSLAVDGIKVCDKTLPDGKNCPSEEGPFFFPDDQHCSRYWQCHFGCATHMMCERDFLFDTDLHMCNPPEKVDCQDRSCDDRKPCSKGSTTPLTKPTTKPTNPTTKVTTKATTTLTTIPTTMTTTTGTITSTATSSGTTYHPEGICHPNKTCNVVSGLAPLGLCENCFCECSPGNIWDKECCPAGLIFDSKIGACNYEEDVDGCNHAY